MTIEERLERIEKRNRRLTAASRRCDDWEVSAGDVKIGLPIR
jgi:hypothetical protein